MRDRFARQQLIPGWRQERLSKARVLVAGAGALGNEVLKNLALVGVGTLVIVDSDRVEASNLSRTVLFRAPDRGKPKARCAAVALRRMAPDLRVIPVVGDVRLDVGLGLFMDSDLVVSCLDNREARLWVNRQCWKAGVPWVDGAIEGLSGVCRVFVPPKSACYECGMTDADYALMSRRYSCSGPVTEAPTASLLSTASLIGALQSQEALKLLQGWQVSAGTAWVFNGSTNNVYQTRLPRKRDCLSHESIGKTKRVSVRQTDPLAKLLKLDGRRRAIAVLDRETVLDVRVPSRTVHRIGWDSPLVHRRLRDLGVPPEDVVRVESGRIARFYRVR